MTPDDNLAALIDRVLAQVRAPLEANLHGFAQDVQQQASAAQAAAVEHAVAAAERESRTQLEQLRDELLQVRRALDTEVSEIRRLAAAEIEGARRQAEAQLDESSHGLAAARREADDTRRELERLQHEVDAASRAAEASGHERTSLQRSLDEMRHAATLASETLSGVAVRTQQMIDAIHAIDGAGSIGEVLEQLAHAAKSSAQRTVLLMVRGAQLTAWRTGDFPGLAGAPLPVDASGLIGRAVSLRQLATCFEGTPDSELLPSFAADGRGRDAAALPIVLGGETVAVLYADAVRGPGDGADRRWPSALDVVTRYASRVIEIMTLRRSVAVTATTRGSTARGSESAS